jgi:hypothetical protein
MHCPPKMHIGLIPLWMALQLKYMSQTVRDLESLIA